MLDALRCLAWAYRYLDERNKTITITESNRCRYCRCSNHAISCLIYTSSSRWENQRHPGPLDPSFPMETCVPRAVALSSCCWTPSFAANNSSLGGPGAYIHLGGEIAVTRGTSLRHWGDFILLLVKVLLNLLWFCWIYYNLLWFSMIYNDLRFVRGNKTWSWSIFDRQPQRDHGTSLAFCFVGHET